eukprot:1711998-Prymnesium_polylepis.1
MPDGHQDALKKAMGQVVTGVRLGGSTPSKGKNSRDNIRVGVRCRPLSKTEIELEQDEIVQFFDQSILLSNPAPEAGQASEHVMAFDHIYDMESNAQTVFEEMGQPLVQALFDGFNATILAYGQTGSGKTHSMMGSKSDPGVIPRFCVEVFSMIHGLPEGVKSTVTASYIQIYCEELQDLLGSDGGRNTTARAPEQLKIRRDPQKGTYVQGLSERTLQSAEGLEAMIELGNKRRAVAATKMNATSSRSHAMVVINLEL